MLNRRENHIRISRRVLWRIILLVSFVIITHGTVYSQVQPPTDTLKRDSVPTPAERRVEENLFEQFDLGDLANYILHPKRPPGPPKMRSGIIVIPNVASNPSIGSQIGIKAVAGKKLGGDPRTLL